MKRYAKITASVLSVLMMCTAVGCFAASAEDSGSIVEPVISTPDDNPVDPISAPDIPVEEPDDGGGGYDDGGGGQQSYTPDDSGYQPSYVPDDGYSDQSSYSGGGQSYNNNSSWIDGDGNVYSNPNDVYVGGGQSYNPPQSTAPSAALYDVNTKKADDGTLSGNDWKDIAAKLKNSGSSPADNDDGSGDFAFIQQNTAKEDNGHWIIIAGVVCLLLSLTGFIYLIASAISRRSKMKAVAAGGKPQNDRFRADDDYDDGYSKPAKKEKTPRNGKRYK